MRPIPLDDYGPPVRTFHKFAEPLCLLSQLITLEYAHAPIFSYQQFCKDNMFYRKKLVGFTGGEILSSYFQMK
jgi:hypothetical protein